MIGVSVLHATSGFPMKLATECERNRMIKTQKTILEIRCKYPSWSYTQIGLDFLILSIFSMAQFNILAPFERRQMVT
jgi:hypothetical protein